MITKHFRFNYGLTYMGTRYWAKFLNFSGWVAAKKSKNVTNIDWFYAVIRIWCEFLLIFIWFFIILGIHGRPRFCLIYFWPGSFWVRTNARSVDISSSKNIDCRQYISSPASVTNIDDTRSYIKRNTYGIGHLT